MNAEELRQDIMTWFAASRLQIMAALSQPLDVDTKSNRNDLVTNVDRANQNFLFEQIHAKYPQATIVGEENNQHSERSLDGLVFFVDPIDGTMNFVKQRAHYAVMIGVYLDGQPLAGAIMDVERDKVLSGGPSIPVTFGNQTLDDLPDLPLKAGLLGLNGPMAVHDRFHLGTIGLSSSGIRMSGSAGMEFIEVALGRQIGYVSYLQPWDVAAAMAIIQGLGVIFTREDGSVIDLLVPGIVVAATPQAHAEILTAMQA